MPTNRHRRRAAAARARRSGLPTINPQSPWGRLALALVGLALIAVSVLLVLNPHGSARSMRGEYFALVIGLALVVSAFIAGRS